MTADTVKIPTVHEMACGSVARINLPGPRTIEFGENPAGGDYYVRHIHDGRDDVGGYRMYSDARRSYRALIQAFAPQELPVIFKKASGIAVVAFFPTLPGTRDKFTCLCYSHQEQHGSAGVGYAHTLPPAKPSEYRELLAEVRARYPDYAMVVRKNFAARDVLLRERALGARK